MAFMTTFVTTDTDDYDRIQLIGQILQSLLYSWSTA